MEEILEVPPGDIAALPHAGLLYVGGTKQLHPHHSKYEDDDDQHEGQVRERPESVLHNGQDVVERLP